MKIREAEKEYGIHLVDREHLSHEDVEYWLDQECEIEQNDSQINFYANDGFIGTLPR